MRSMPRGPSDIQVRHLVSQLRQAAILYQAMALERDDGCWELCVGAALANDAAEALEALQTERAPKNDRPSSQKDHDREAKAPTDIR